MSRFTPAFIELIHQRDEGDCAVCCLTMLLGQPYSTIVRHAKPRATRSGMSGEDMKRVAQALGVTLTTHRSIDLDDDVGILTVLDKGIPKGAKDYDSHAVLLVQGSIYDPANGGRYYPDVDTFLQMNKYRLGTLLRRSE